MSYSKESTPNAEPENNHHHHHNHSDTEIVGGGDRTSYSGPLSGPLNKRGGRKSARFNIPETSNTSDDYVEITLDVREDSVAVHSVKTAGGGEVEDPELALLAKGLEKKSSFGSSVVRNASSRIRQVSQELKRLASSRAALTRRGDLTGPNPPPRTRSRGSSLLARRMVAPPGLGWRSGMNKESKEFAGELFDALARRRNISDGSVTKAQLKEFWDQISDQSFDSRLQTFFDMVDKDADGRITEEEVREKQADEYARLIMEELDPNELGYIMRVWVMLLWIGIMAGLFTYKYIQYKNRAVFEVMGHCVCMAKGAAETLKLNMALILLPVCRNTITWLRNKTKLGVAVPFDDNLNFHKVIAVAIALGVGIHGISHLACDFPRLLNASPEAYEPMEQYWDDQPTSYWHFIREKQSKPTKTIEQTHWVQCLLVAVYPGNVLALHMSKPQGFKYKSGQYIFVNCAAVSPFEWHPFSITSAPRDDYVSVHIRTLGDWTRQLKAVFSEVCQPPPTGKSGLLRADFLQGENNPNFPKVLIDGPYGAPTQDYKNYDVVLLVGLGIGATPMISVVKDIVNNIKAMDDEENALEDGTSLTPNASPLTTPKRKTGSGRHDFKTRRAYFYWVTREQGSFDWFKGVMNEVAEMDHKGVIEMHNYCTSVYEEGDARSALITMLQSLNHAKNGVDVVSGTRVKSHFAKPNWRTVYKRIALNHPNARVGVFYCGAPPPVKELRQLASDFSHKTNTKFEFHKENF
ncbi:hypothetical protein DH2020_018853 [Rehmannia glutinosa]|uniref:Uncharacterized protein n=1 Tax=Rehmannia glutinosa TaxID=99300 RepID=A0ABR0WM20_REHGL